MQRCYLVCYDICDAKRLRFVFRTMKGYGHHWQYSVFFCKLRRIDRIRMQSELEDGINQKEDKIMIIDLGADEENARKAVTFLGPSLPEINNDILVI